MLLWNERLKNALSFPLPMTDIPPFKEWAEWEGMKEPEKGMELGGEETWDEFLSNMTTVTKGLLEKLGEYSPKTLEHSKRVAIYSILMGKCLGFEGIDSFILESGALLHDIGVLDVPVEILENPQVYEEVERGEPKTLSHAEYELFRSHASLGYSAILDEVPLMSLAEIAFYHHERLDGSGYFRLEDERIPPLAKVIAVADSYDMMTEMYTEKRSPSEALEELKALGGTKYDTIYVKALELVLEELGTIEG